MCNESGNIAEIARKSQSLIGNVIQETRKPSSLFDDMSQSLIGNVILNIIKKNIKQ